MLKIIKQHHWKINFLHTELRQCFRKQKHTSPSWSYGEPIRIDTENTGIVRTLKAVQEKIPRAEHSFFEVDLGHVVRQFDRIQRLLPRVKPYYAVKCQPDPHVINLLASMGAGFDCASLGEVNLVVNHLCQLHGFQKNDEALKKLVEESIIFANPFKFKGDMNFASECGVVVTTFDTPGELTRLEKYWPNAKLLIRVRTRKKFNAKCPLGNKFGTNTEDIEKLVKIARQIGFDVIGASFHVGNMCYDYDAWSDTVKYCADVFDIISSVGCSPYLLDIGGGFVGQSSVDSIEEREIQEKLDETFTSLSQTIDTYFPESLNYEIISEPGTYFVFGAYTLATEIIGKRELSHKDFDEKTDRSRVVKEGSLEFVDLKTKNTGLTIEEVKTIHSEGVENQENLNMYILDDGVYGSFNILMFSEYTFLLLCVTRSDGAIRQLDAHHSRPLSKVYGPTCDTWDCIFPATQIPDVDVGDWLVWADLGAYTNASRTDFNGINQPISYYHMSIFDKDRWTKNVERFQNNESTLKLPKLNKKHNK